MMRARRNQSGQATVEYALLTAGVIIPLVFGLIYVCELLWVWHSVSDFTRNGARYAVTHCWQASGDNVVNYMKNNVPLMVDRDQFQTGSVNIVVNYYGKDPNTGQLADFTCDTECSTQCIPDAVTVSVTNYEFRNFVGYLGLPPVVMPPFQTSMPVESAGCDPDQGTCLP